MALVEVAADLGSKSSTTSISAHFLVCGHAQTYWIDPVSGS
jgi:hypothetical protein